MVGKTPRGPYVAAVFVGAPADDAETDLEAARVGLAESILQAYYPHERPRGDLDPALIEVGGQPACRIVVSLDIDDPNLDIGSETAVFVLVDLGGGTRGVLDAGLPEAEHVP